MSGESFTHDLLELVGIVSIACWTMDHISGTLARLIIRIVVAITKRKEWQP